MKNKNIFITGGQVSGDSVIGYSKYQTDLKRLIEEKKGKNGGIYIYGLYRMGKTSLIKNVIPYIEECDNRILSIYINLNLFNCGNDDDYTHFLKAVVKSVKDKLRKRKYYVPTVIEKIEEFNDISTSTYFFYSFLEIFEELKESGIRILLVIDEFDAAKDIFRSKSNFELFRELAASETYSVCLITVSRQELSQIENENPNNSSFKGIMYPFVIKGFSDDDIADFCSILKTDYDHLLSENDVNVIKGYCGSSPYLWSCIGYEIAEYRLQCKTCSLDDILNSTVILTKIRGFYNSIVSCLEHDKDRNGVSFADKLISAIIGPSFLVSESDIKLLTSMNYLIDTGVEYLAFSRAFKKYLMEIKYSNDTLNSFDTLEKKMKVLIESQKERLFSAVNATNSNEDENWFEVLNDTWNKLENKTFNPSIYRSQITSTSRKFNKYETVLNVMSLEDVMRIVRNNWYIFSSKFNDDTLEKWEIHLKECGKARNPVHHGSIKRIYTIEEQDRINSYCLEIIKQIS